MLLRWTRPRDHECEQMRDARAGDCRGANTSRHTRSSTVLPNEYWFHNDHALQRLAACVSITAHCAGPASSVTESTCASTSIVAVRAHTDMPSIQVHPDMRLPPPARGTSRSTPAQYQPVADVDSPGLQQIGPATKHRMVTQEAQLSQVTGQEK